MNTADSNVSAAIAAIQAAKTRNDALQAQFDQGSPNWHACETVDDRLHDALGALGE